MKKLDLINKDIYEFCIVKDFPMYEYSLEEDKYVYCHNPFSMPKDEYDMLKKENMDKITAIQYNFVCNGYEMASGAIRNHDLSIMKKVFGLVDYSDEDIKNKFGSLYEAFAYGAPPHGGMAIGIERTLMLLGGIDSIRVAVAFPMSSNGEDLMMSSPSIISEKQLREVHIKER